VLSLLSCEDEKSTAGSHLPPDLRLEDLVGCWWNAGDNRCELQCYDRNYLRIYQEYDSLSGRLYESLQHFSIAGPKIGYRGRNASTGNGIFRDSIFGSIPLAREGYALYVLDNDYSRMLRFVVVDLDSILPCGQPFAFFPKPANWTLF
jgi:hypothetical protein